MSIDAINEALELLRIMQEGLGKRDWCHKEWDRISKCREGLEGLRQQEPAGVAKAPPNSLPTWDECALRVANSDFIEKRVAEGGYGPEPDSKLATELHRFIYEYDDKDPYRSAWFLHRLELVLEEVKQEACSAAPVPVAVPEGWKLVRAHAVREKSGNLSFGADDELRFAPLCWVEGRPVYKGSVLYRLKGSRCAITVDRVERRTFCECAVYGTDGLWNAAEDLTWAPPKVKCEGWIVADIEAARNMTSEQAHKITEIAPNRLQAIRIEWEESAPQKGGEV